MKFIKFHTNIFYGQLQHVPEPRQVLGGGPRMSIGILYKRKKNIHALEAVWDNKHRTQGVFSHISNNIREMSSFQLSNRS